MFIMSLPPAEVTLRPRFSAACAAQRGAIEDRSAFFREDAGEVATQHLRAALGRPFSVAVNLPRQCFQKPVKRKVRLSPLRAVFPLGDTGTCLSIVSGR